MIKIAASMHCFITRDKSVIYCYRPFKTNKQNNCRNVIPLLFHSLAFQFKKWEKQHNSAIHIAMVLTKFYISLTLKIPVSLRFVYCAELDINLTNIDKQCFNHWRGYFV